ncbi:MAG: YncE family protein [Thiobacillus sp.]
MFTLIQSGQLKRKATVLGSAIALVFSASAWAQSGEDSNSRNSGRSEQNQSQFGGMPWGSDGSQNDRERFEVVDTITGVTTPHGINVMPIQKKLWVANESMNTASRIDIDSGRLETVVQVGQGPDLVSTDKLRQKVWITNLKGNSVSVLNADTGAELARIPVGKEPHGLAIDQARGRVYVANYKDQTVFMFDARTHEKLKSIAVGKGPRNIALDTLTGNIFVTNMDENTVSLVNPHRGTEITRMKVGTKPAGLDFNYLTRTLYVSNTGSGNVSVLRNGREMKKIPVGANPRGIQINLTTNQVFVNVLGEGMVAVVDGFTDAIRQKVKVGSGNYVASLDITTNTLYVANQLSNTISVVRPVGSAGMGEGRLPGFFERRNGSGRDGLNADDIGQSLLNR